MFKQIIRNPSAWLYGCGLGMSTIWWAWKTGDVERLMLYMELHSPITTKLSEMVVELRTIWYNGEWTRWSSISTVLAYRWKSQIHRSNMPM